MMSDDYLEWVDYNKRGGQLDYEEWHDKYIEEDEDGIWMFDEDYV